MRQLGLLNVKADEVKVQLLEAFSCDFHSYYSGAIEVNYNEKGKFVKNPIHIAFMSLKEKK